MVNSYSYIQQSRTRETANANEMRFLIVLAMLATVALANPLISIRVNVDNPNGEGGLPPPPPPPGPGPNPDPEVPPPQPYTKQQLKRDVAATDGKVVFPVPTNDGNPAARWSTSKSSSTTSAPVRAVQGSPRICHHRNPTKHLTS
ncbi:hypothetical protein ZHAS_00021407 [Anopheles sinensis]|uniref:Uncharacterized protein n=1 Tax=Anopheles sinensis TaxID=74873 RepID=A0A084WSB9_ANOSI|nr:hypothetical protein ZHAS_00021407 [Anopheles sinensis]